MWCMARFIVKNRHQKQHVLLRAQTMDTDLQLGSKENPVLDILQLLHFNADSETWNNNLRD